MDNFNLVLKAYDELFASGDIIVGKNVDEQKAILTRRAAYYINQVNPNIGLLQKTSGNNIQGLSVDIILDKSSGNFWDIATDVNGLAKPIEGQLKNDKSLISRWIQPTLELAGLTSSSPIPSSEDKLNQSKDKLNQIEQTLENITNMLTIMSQNIKDVNENMKNPPIYEARTMLGTIVMKPRK